MDVIGILQVAVSVVSEVAKLVAVISDASRAAAVKHVSARILEIRDERTKGGSKA